MLEGSTGTDHLDVSISRTRHKVPISIIDDDTVDSRGVCSHSCHYLLYTQVNNDWETEGVKDLDNVGGRGAWNFRKE